LDHAIHVVSINLVCDLVELPSRAAEYQPSIVVTGFRLFVQAPRFGTVFC
jgi:hypothetical protein